jgi:hypothetical protein
MHKIEHWWQALHNADAPSGAKSKPPSLNAP